MLSPSDTTDLDIFLLKHLTIIRGTQDTTQTQQWCVDLKVTLVHGSDRGPFDTEQKLFG